MEREFGVPERYNAFYSFCSRKGYSGVATFVKESCELQPTEAHDGFQSFGIDLKGFGDEELASFDVEGRLIATYHDVFWLLNVYLPYCPNETSEERLPYKMRFYQALEELTGELKKLGHNVIIAGDINACRDEMDHCDPEKSNKEYNLKNFGDHPARKWLNEFIDRESMVDLFRHYHPNEQAKYTCWNTLINARPANYGTRIDYFLISSSLLEWCRECTIDADVMGSDHCPISLKIDIPHSLVTSKSKSISRLCTKFFPEYSTKQRTLASFVLKKPRKFEAVIDQIPKQADIIITDTSSELEGEELLKQVEKIDETVKRTSENLRKWSSLPLGKGVPIPTCFHGDPCKELTVNKSGPNKGRKFYICSRMVGPGYENNKTKAVNEFRCNFFEWKNGTKRKLSEDIKGEDMKKNIANDLENRLIFCPMGALSRDSSTRRSLRSSKAHNSPDKLHSENDDEHSKSLMESIWCRVGIASLIILTILVIICLLVMRFYIPVLVQKSFANFSTSGSWPRIDVNNFVDKQIYMNVSSHLAFTNYFDTDIIFETPFTFKTNNTLVGDLDFPNLNVGYNRRHFLNETFCFNIRETQMWTRLWKKWVRRATDKKAPDYILAGTFWDIEAIISLKMLGYTWRGIPIKKTVEWNGGLSRDMPIVDISLKHWSLTGSFVMPGLRLVLEYGNKAKVGINFGRMKLSVYNVFRTNQTHSEPVYLLSIQIPKFNYLPGVHNITIENEFQGHESKSIRSVFQMGTNYIANETSIIVIKDFKSSHNVHWLNDVLEALSFVLKFNRGITFLNMIRSRADTLADKFKANIEQIGGELNPKLWDYESNKINIANREADNDAITKLIQKSREKST